MSSAIRDDSLCLCSLWLSLCVCLGGGALQWQSWGKAEKEVVEVSSTGDIIGMIYQNSEAKPFELVIFPVSYLSLFPLELPAVGKEPRLKHSVLISSLLFNYLSLSVYLSLSRILYLYIFQQIWLFGINWQLSWMHFGFLNWALLSPQRVKGETRFQSIL